MPVNQNFGPINHGGLVEQALLDILEAHMPGYCAEISAQHLAGDAEPFKAPLSYLVCDEDSLFPDGPTPAIRVMCDGLAPESIDNDGGRIKADFDATIGITTRSTSRVDAQLNAHVYTALVWTILLQHPSLGGVAAGVKLAGGSTGEGESDDQARSTGIGVVAVKVTLDPLLDLYSGPRDPVDPDDPPGPLPTIETVSISVDPIDLGDLPHLS